MGVALIVTVVDCLLLDLPPQNICEELSLFPRMKSIAYTRIDLGDSGCVRLILQIGKSFRTEMRERKCDMQQSQPFP
jgi:hypothetical protein